MPDSTIRIGIVGAGANTRLRHIPGFQAISGVKLLGVVNSRPESTRRAAEEFGIPRTYPGWQALIEDPDIDAVLIGAWPNLHGEVTCAALAAGKHVLTEARMARNAAEARTMLAAAQAHPNLITQIVPSPFGLVEHNHVSERLEAGFLGELRELVVIGADASFHDDGQPLHWRQDREISGLNLLAMGILHETAMRWTPPARRVFAQAATFSRRTNPVNGAQTKPTVPDSVQIVTELEGGARGIYHLSGIGLFGPGKQIHLYGSQGTIKLQFDGETGYWAGRLGDRALEKVEIPAEQRGGWRVEAEFIGAIRGEEPVRFTDFETGVKYMEFTEAVARSAESGQPIHLPLKNPESNT